MQLDYGDDEGVLNEIGHDGDGELVLHEHAREYAHELGAKKTKLKKN